MQKKCGAKTRAGTRCKKLAGSGTSHLGTGKCKLHGGASSGAPKGNTNTVKHGIYSRVISKEDLNDAYDMEGSLHIELAIARIQLMRLLEKQNKEGDEPTLDRIEERTIVDFGKQQSLIRQMEQDAIDCGEYYNGDGDEDLVQEKESSLLSRSRIFVRRDFQIEFVRLSNLIIKHELAIRALQEKDILISIAKKPKEGTGDDYSKLTDSELDQEFLKLFQQ